MTQKAQKPRKSPPMTLQGGLVGIPTPRIHTPLNDLPSRGQEFIYFCEKIGYPLLEWQKFLSIHTMKIKPDGRYATTENVLVVSRQNGKSTYMALQIIWRMLHTDKLQVGTAHKLTTSSETFFKIFEIIESVPELAAQFAKKIESKGSQELRFQNGSRYLIRANNAASRGIASVDTIWMDEVREYKDEDVWAAMRYAQMSAQNPQTYILSSAGDQHSIILNKFRERALAAIAGNSDPNLAYFEWSAPEDITEINPEDPKFWDGLAQANPSLGHIIHPDNLRAVLNDDESIVRTEVLTQWVDTINPLISPQIWGKSADDKKTLDPDLPIYLGLDLTPDRRDGALVAAQRLPLEKDRFLCVLLHTWHNDVQLDAKAVANDVANYVRQYPTDGLLYSTLTSAAVAQQLRPVGIPLEAIDGAEYQTACDMFLSSVNSYRLVHTNQPELNKQALAAVKLPKGDGGFVIGRKASSANVAAAVAMAMCSYYLARPDLDDDIIVM